MDTRHRGFTLIELMIVITVIAIIAGIALPSLLGAKRAANESSAISSLRTISTACEQYRNSALPHSYPAALVSLTVAGGAQMDYLDSLLATGNKGGYLFNLIGANPDAAGGLTTYQAWATPLNASTGNRAFFLDQTGAIRQRQGTLPAGPGDMPIE